MIYQRTSGYKIRIYFVLPAYPKTEYTGIVALLAFYKISKHEATLLQ